MVAAILAVAGLVFAFIASWAAEDKKEPINKGQSKIILSKLYQGKRRK